MAIQIQENQIKDSAISNAKIANATIQPAKIDLSQVFSFGAIPTVSSDATSGNQLVRKSQLDAAINGLSWKEACRVKATGNVDISSAPSSIDGVTLSNGDRVLLDQQTTGSEDGIYIFNGSSSAMARSGDADAFSELQDGTAVFIKEGSTFASNGYQQSATLTSFSNQNWILFSSTGGGRQAGDALDLSGNTFNVKYDDSAIGVDGSDQLTVKAGGISNSMIGSGVVANDRLINSAITVTAGAGLTGGGTPSLGGSTTIAVQSDSSNTISVSGSGIGVADASLQAAKLASNSVTTNKVADGNITLDKLVNMSDSQIMVGNSSNRPAFVSMSGDASISNTGALSLNSNAVSTSIVQDSAITNIKLANSQVTLVAGDGVATLGNLALGASMNVNLVLDGSTLAKGASGLKVSSGGITSTELAANSVTSSAIADDAVGSTEIAANAVQTVKIQDDAVTLAKCGFQWVQEVYTGTTSTTYDLSNAVDSGFEDAIFVFRNGLLCQKVGSPSDDSEYSVAVTGGTGGVCRLTFGSAPNGDKLIVKYML